MRYMVLGTAVAAALLTSSPVFAQVSADITIGQPEQTRIKEYIVKEKVKPTMIKEKVVVGTTLADDVELHSAPTDWGPTVSRYRYIYTNDNVVLIDPTTRRVVHIVD
jgi:hypothetical protein